MNDLGKRLNDLARRATSGVSLSDPSVTKPTAARPQRARSVAFALLTVLAAVMMLFVWQGRDSSTTSVAAGQVEGETATEFLGDETCAVEPLLEIMRAGIPTYDYNPAGSFDALANQSAAVVAGQVVSIVRTEVNGRSYIEITVAGVFDVTFDNGVDTTRNDIQTIAYDAQWADRSSSDPLASPVAVEGLDFFAFLSPWSGVRGGWAPGPEGLYVSCNGPGIAVAANGAGPNDPTDPGQWWAVRTAEQAAGQAMADAAAAAEVANDELPSESDEEPFFHTVQTGDRLGSIAEKYNVTVDLIIRANPQMDPNLIIAGELLRIPGAVAVREMLKNVGPDRSDGLTVSYVVQPGDTFGQIAHRWTVSLAALLEANADVDPATLRVNQLLTIPPWGTGLDASQLTPRVTPVPATPATPEDLAGLQQATIEMARELWGRSVIDSYRLSYAEFRPEGMAGLVTVVVENGVVSTSTQPADATGPVYTVDALFGLALTSDSVREFEFDLQTGYPTVISVDPDSTVAGDEFAIRNIEVVPGA